MIVVALDGPAGSGKSTVGRAVALALGVDVLDTGAMYRALTAGVLRAGIDPTDGEACATLAREVGMEVGDTVTIDGLDVTDEIRGPDVTAHVSQVSAHPDVRDEMVRRQRSWIAERRGGVVEGRDIGTVVFPDAPVKIFLVADADIRAQRRQSDELAAARETKVVDVLADIERRDHLDSTRVVAPLQPAADALVVDTSRRSVEDVVEMVLEAARSAGLTP